MKKEKTIHHVSSDVLAALAQARYLTMQAKNIKAVIICASSAGIIIATANAEPTITWQAPITIIMRPFMRMAAVANHGPTCLFRTMPLRST